MRDQAIQSALQRDNQSITRGELTVSANETHVAIHARNVVGWENVVVGLRREDALDLAVLLNKSLNGAPATVVG